MVARLALAVVVAVVVTLGCMLLGGIMATLGVPVAVTVGQFLAEYATILGVLAGIWQFFAGFTWPKAPAA